MELQRARAHVPRADFRLAGLVVQPSLGRIASGGATVHVRPKLMDVLAFLSTRSGQVVSKDELLDAVWPDQFVDENALTRAIADLRQLIESDLEQPRLIETIPKRGYRLLAPTEGPARPAEREAGPGEMAPVPLPFDLGVPETAVGGAATIVARDAELGRLADCLATAIAGHGRVVFVSGEVGTGKTALLGEFARRAEAAHAGLLVVSGRGQAHTGAGDPYLPFRQVLAMLTGDLESQWAERAVRRAQVARLWDAVPVAVDALVQHGPDLVGTIVPGLPLIARLGPFAPANPGWLARLRALADPADGGTAAGAPSQTDLFGQMGDVLSAVSRHRPILIVLDDLQWADVGSIALLFQIGREIAGSRILIAGLYREADVALGRDGQRHPLESVVNELVRQHGDAVVALPPAGDQAFVDAVIDREANRLGAAFRTALFVRTAGHPLFTIELLRSLADAGAIARDAEGRWVEGVRVDSTAWPARVESAIQERVSRLPDPLRRLLAVASVEGEEFTAEVVARVAGASPADTVMRLGSDLDKRHHLVRAVGVERLGDQRLSMYRFQHVLAQRYLYESLDIAERAYLHEGVGAALEALHGEGADLIANRLAHHFERAGVGDKAVRYLGCAGDQAVQLAADGEAIAHYRRALGLIAAAPPSAGLQGAELGLQLRLVASLFRRAGAEASEIEPICDRARQLCAGAPDDPQLFVALLSLIAVDAMRGDYRSAGALSEQAVGLARRLQAPALETMLQSLGGPFRLRAGDLAGARVGLELPLGAGVPWLDRHVIALTGVHPEVWRLSWLAYAMWLLGYPDQALARAGEAGAVADGLGHPSTIVHALSLQAVIRLHRREGALAWPFLDAALQQSSRHGFGFYRMLGDLLQGWALMECGEPEQALEAIGRVRKVVGAGVVKLDATKVLARAAEACLRLGRVEEGIAAADEGMAFAQAGGEIYYVPELLRIRGLLLARGGREVEGERSLVEAVGAARQMQARSWELRAATDIARLWQAQGRGAEAAPLVGDVLSWFSEGSDAPDLADARSVMTAIGPR